MLKYTNIRGFWNIQVYYIVQMEQNWHWRAILIRWTECLCSQGTGTWSPWPSFYDAMVGVGATLCRSWFRRNLGIIYAFCSLVTCVALMWYISFVLRLMENFLSYISFLSIIFSHIIQSWVFNIFFIVISVDLLNYCISIIPTPISVPGSSSTH